MHARKRKALERLVETAKTHIGHDITYNQGETAIVQDAQILNETVMVREKGQPFATIYIDSIRKCSCKN